MLLLPESKAPLRSELPSYSDALHDQEGSSKGIAAEKITPPPPPLPPRVQQQNLPHDVQFVRSLSSQTNYKSITGTYCVDPDLANHAFEIQSQLPSNKGKGKGKGKKRFSTPPNAYFYAKHGNVSLSMAASSSSGSTRPAHVHIGTGTGNVVISLFEAKSFRHINLDVSSRRGHIFLLVHRTFCGVIQLRSCRGKLTFLPSFARNMRMLKSEDDSALVLFSTPQRSTESQSTGETSFADYCELTTRQGNVTVGIANEDRFSSPSSSFWTKLGEFFSGESSGS